LDLNNKKIAVLGLKRIGDAVYTLPVFEAIKKQYPTANIELFTESHVTAIYQNNPFLDEIRSLAKKDYWSAVLRGLRQGGFDVCIVWHNALKYALLPFLAGVPVRLGYQKEMRSIFLTHRRPLHKTVVHRLEHMALLLDLLEVDSRGLLPTIYQGIAETAESENLLSRCGLEPQAYVAFIVGSIAQTRRWFPENFAQVAQRIVAEHSLKVVILGGLDDREIADQVMRLCADKSADIQNLAGQTSLRETIMLFRQSKAVVTNDTGPLHVASAVGVPVVTWFGAANELEIKPPSKNTVVLNAHVACGPCVDEVCSQHTLECLHKITPDWVMDTLKQVMDSAEADTHSG
jgi:lipopolysaccharide heptosyltransferase II